MPGEKILRAEMEAIEAQSINAHHSSYDVYVDNYTDYGDWYDCKDYH